MPQSDTASLPCKTKIDVCPVIRVKSGAEAKLSGVTIFCETINIIIMIIMMIITAMEREEQRVVTGVADDRYAEERLW